jgi:antitoxin PrlF
MVLAQSRITAQGQVSVPAEVRKRLGIGPGSVIEWEQEGDKLIVRRAKKHTLHDLHSALFPSGAPAYKTDADLNEGIKKHLRSKHARR